MARNPKLVYGRMTGWGQDGPMAPRAGHDINYIALSGALHAIGPRGEKPVVPLNLIGDFGGGGMLLAFGLVCAILNAQRSGKGQVVDAAMVDGAAVLMSWFFSMRASNMFSEHRGTNMLDGGAPFYDTYETSDGKYVAVGAIEPQFYGLLVERMELDAELFAQQMDFTRWDEQKQALAAIFKTRTRDQWTALLEDLDACFSPILEMSEAPSHPHNQARNTFVEIDGLVQPAPAPRFSGTSPEIGAASRTPGQDTNDVLAEFGFSQNDIDQLQASGALS